MDAREDKRRRDRTALTGQALYFLISGVWPILHIRSFTFITGPKADIWLVKTFGALVAAAGFAMCFAVRRGKAETEAAVLGASTAAVLGGCDVYYVARRRISPAYLSDAVLEFVFLGYWLARWAAGARFDLAPEEALPLPGGAMQAAPARCFGARQPVTGR